MSEIVEELENELAAYKIQLEEYPLNSLGTSSENNGGNIAYSQELLALRDGFEDLKTKCMSAITTTESADMIQRLFECITVSSECMDKITNGLNNFHGIKPQKPSILREKSISKLLSYGRSDFQARQADEVGSRSQVSTASLPYGIISEHDTSVARPTIASTGSNSVSQRSFDISSLTATLGTSIDNPILSITSPNNDYFGSNAGAPENYHPLNDHPVEADSRDSTGTSVIELFRYLRSKTVEISTSSVLGRAALVDLFNKMLDDDNQGAAIEEAWEIGGFFILIDLFREIQVAILERDRTQGPPSRRKDCRLISSRSSCARAIIQFLRSHAFAASSLFDDKMTFVTRSHSSLLFDEPTETVESISSGPSKRRSGFFFSRRDESVIEGKEKIKEKKKSTNFNYTEDPKSWINAASHDFVTVIDCIRVLLDDADDAETVAGIRPGISPECPSTVPYQASFTPSSLRSKAPLADPPAKDTVASSNLNSRPNESFGSLYLLAAEGLRRIVEVAESNFRTTYQDTRVVAGDLIKLARSAIQESNGLATVESRPDRKHKEKDKEKELKDKDKDREKEKEREKERDRDFQKDRESIRDSIGSNPQLLEQADRFFSRNIAATACVNWTGALLVPLALRLMEKPRRVPLPAIDDASRSIINLNRNSARNQALGVVERIVFLSAQVRDCMAAVVQYVNPDGNRQSSVSSSSTSSSKPFQSMNFNWSSVDYSKGVWMNGQQFSGGSSPTLLNPVYPSISRIEFEYVCAFARIQSPLMDARTELVRNGLFLHLNDFMSGELRSQDHLKNIVNILHNVLCRPPEGIQADFLSIPRSLMRVLRSSPMKSPSTLSHSNSAFHVVEHSHTHGHTIGLLRPYGMGHTHVHAHIDFDSPLDLHRAVTGGPSTTFTHSSGLGLSQVDRAGSHTNVPHGVSSSASSASSTFVPGSSHLASSSTLVERERNGGTASPLKSRNAALTIAQKSLAGDIPLINRAKRSGSDPVPAHLKRTSSAAGRLVELESSDVSIPTAAHSKSRSPSVTISPDIIEVPFSFYPLLELSVPVGYAPSSHREGHVPYSSRAVGVGGDQLATSVLLASQDLRVDLSNAKTAHQVWEAMERNFVSTDILARLIKLFLPTFSPSAYDAIISNKSKDPVSSKVEKGNDHVKTEYSLYKIPQPIPLDHTNFSLLASVFDIACTIASASQPVRTAALRHGIVAFISSSLIYLMSESIRKDRGALPKSVVDAAAAAGKSKTSSRRTYGSNSRPMSADHRTSKSVHHSTMGTQSSGNRSHQPKSVSANSPSTVLTSLGALHSQAAQSQRLALTLSNLTSHQGNHSSKGGHESLLKSKSEGSHLLVESAASGVIEAPSDPHPLIPSASSLGADSTGHLNQQYGLLGSQPSGSRLVSPLVPSSSSELPSLQRIHSFSRISTPSYPEHLNVMPGALNPSAVRSNSLSGPPTPVISGSYSAHDDSNLVSSAPAVGFGRIGSMHSTGLSELSLRDPSVASTKHFLRAQASANLRASHTFSNSHSSLSVPAAHPSPTLLVADGTHQSSIIPTSGSGEHNSSLFAPGSLGVANPGMLGSSTFPYFRGHHPRALSGSDIPGSPVSPILGVTSEMPFLSSMEANGLYNPGSLITKSGKVFNGANTSAFSDFNVSSQYNTDQDGNMSTTSNNLTLNSSALSRSPSMRARAHTDIMLSMSRPHSRSAIGIAERSGLGGLSDYSVTTHSAARSRQPSLAFERNDTISGASVREEIDDPLVSPHSQSMMIPPLMNMRTGRSHYMNLEMSMIIPMNASTTLKPNLAVAVLSLAKLAENSDPMVDSLFVLQGGLYVMLESLRYQSVSMKAKLDSHREKKGVQNGSGVGISEKIDNSVPDIFTLQPSIYVPALAVVAQMIDSQGTKDAAVGLALACSGAPAPLTLAATTHKHGVEAFVTILKFIGPGLVGSSRFVSTTPMEAVDGLSVLEGGRSQHPNSSLMHSLSQSNSTISFGTMGQSAANSGQVNGVDIYGPSKSNSNDFPPRLNSGENVSQDTSKVAPLSETISNNPGAVPRECECVPGAAGLCALCQLSPVDAFVEARLQLARLFASLSTGLMSVFAQTPCCGAPDAVSCTCGSAFTESASLPPLGASPEIRALLMEIRGIIASAESISQLLLLLANENPETSRQATRALSALCGIPCKLCCGYGTLRSDILSFCHYDGSSKLANTSSDTETTKDEKKIAETTGKPHDKGAIKGDGRVHQRDHTHNGNNEASRAYPCLRCGLGCDALAPVIAAAHALKVRKMYVAPFDTHSQLNGAGSVSPEKDLYVGIDPSAPKHSPAVVNTNKLQHLSGASLSSKQVNSSTARFTSSSVTIPSEFSHTPVDPCEHKPAEDCTNAPGSSTKEIIDLGRGSDYLTVSQLLSSPGIGIGKPDSPHLALLTHFSPGLLLSPALIHLLPPSRYGVLPLLLSLLPAPSELLLEAALLGISRILNAVPAHSVPAVGQFALPLLLAVASDKSAAPGVLAPVHYALKSFGFLNGIHDVRDIFGCSVPLALTFWVNRSKVLSRKRAEHLQLVSRIRAWEPPQQHRSWRRFRRRLGRMDIPVSTMVSILRLSGLRVGSVRHIMDSRVSLSLKLCDFTSTRAERRMVALEHAIGRCLEIEQLFIGLSAQEGCDNTGCDSNSDGLLEPLRYAFKYHLNGWRKLLTPPQLPPSSDNQTQIHHRGHSHRPHIHHQDYELESLDDRSTVSGRSGTTGGLGSIPGHMSASSIFSHSHSYYSHGGHRRAFDRHGSASGFHVTEGPHPHQIFQSNSPVPPSSISDATSQVEVSEKEDRKVALAFDAVKRIFSSFGKKDKEKEKGIEKKNSFSLAKPLVKKDTTTSGSTRPVEEGTSRRLSFLNLNIGSGNPTNVHEATAPSALSVFNDTVLPPIPLNLSSSPVATVDTANGRSISRPLIFSGAGRGTSSSGNDAAIVPKNMTPRTEARMHESQWVLPEISLEGASNIVSHSVPTLELPDTEDLTVDSSLLVAPIDDTSSILEKLQAEGRVVLNDVEVLACTGTWFTEGAQALVNAIELQMIDVEGQGSSSPYSLPAEYMWYYQALSQIVEQAIQECGSPPDDILRRAEIEASDQFRKSLMKSKTAHFLPHPHSVAMSVPSISSHQHVQPGQHFTSIMSLPNTYGLNKGMAFNLSVVPSGVTEASDSWESHGRRSRQDSRFHSHSPVGQGSLSGYNSESSEVSEKYNSADSESGSLNRFDDIDTHSEVGLYINLPLDQLGMETQSQGNWNLHELNTSLNENQLDNNRESRRVVQAFQTLPLIEAYKSRTKHMTSSLHSIRQTGPHEVLTDIITFRHGPNIPMATLLRLPAARRESDSISTDSDKQSNDSISEDDDVELIDTDYAEHSQPGDNEIIGPASEDERLFDGATPPAFENLVEYAGDLRTTTLLQYAAMPLPTSLGFDNNSLFASENSEGLTGGNQSGKGIPEEKSCNLLPLQSAALLDLVGELSLPQAHSKAAQAVISVGQTRPCPCNATGKRCTCANCSIPVHPFLVSSIPPNTLASLMLAARSQRSSSGFPLQPLQKNTFSVPGGPLKSSRGVPLLDPRSVMDKYLRVVFPYGGFDRLNQVSVTIEFASSLRSAFETGEFPNLRKLVVRGPLNPSSSLAKPRLIPSKSAYFSSVHDFGSTVEPYSEASHELSLLVASAPPSVMAFVFAQNPLYSPVDFEHLMNSIIDRRTGPAELSFLQCEGLGSAAAASVAQLMRVRNSQPPDITVLQSLASNEDHLGALGATMMGLPMLLPPPQRALPPGALDCLSHLDFSSCRLGDHGAAEIVKALSHPTSTVLSLNLSLNGIQGGASLCDALTRPNTGLFYRNVTLRFLNLSLNPISEDTATTILRTLAHAKTQTIVPDFFDVPKFPPRDDMPVIELADAADDSMDILLAGRPNLRRSSVEPLLSTSSTPLDSLSKPPEVFTNPAGTQSPIRSSDGIQSIVKFISNYTSGDSSVNQSLGASGGLSSSGSMTAPNNSTGVASIAVAGVVGISNSNPTNLSLSMRPPNASVNSATPMKPPVAPTSMSTPRLLLNSPLQLGSSVQRFRSDGSSFIGLNGSSRFDDSPIDVNTPSRSPMLRSVSSQSTHKGRSGPLTRLSVLGLASCGLASKKVSDALIYCLESNRTLRALDLSCNYLSSECGSRMVVAVTYHMKNFWFLRLAENKSIRDEDRSKINAELRKRRVKWALSRLPRDIHSQLRASGPVRSPLLSALPSGSPRLDVVPEESLDIPPMDLYSLNPPSSLTTLSSQVVDQKPNGTAAPDSVESRKTSTADVPPSQPSVEKPQPHLRVTALFATPLVMLKQSNRVSGVAAKFDILPIDPLDIEAERRTIFDGLNGNASRPNSSSDHDSVALSCGILTADALRRALTHGCDILHLSCHGGDGWMALESPVGDTHVLFDEDLHEILTAGGASSLIRPDGTPRIRLVVLAACKSHWAARRFHEAGVPQVLCVEPTGDVLDSMCLAFLRGLYMSLGAPAGSTVRTAYGVGMQTMREGHKQLLLADTLPSSITTSSTFDGLDCTNPDSVVSTTSSTSGVTSTDEIVFPEFVLYPELPTSPELETALVPRHEDEDELLPPPGSIPPPSFAGVIDRGGPVWSDLLVQLPAVPENFVGRTEASYYIILDLLRSRNRVVTIAGGSGLGKSSLAAFVLRWLSLRRSFHDGIVYVNCHGIRSLRALIATLSRALGIESDIGRASSFVQFFSDIEDDSYRKNSTSRSKGSLPDDDQGLRSFGSSMQTGSGLMPPLGLGRRFHTIALDPEARIREMMTTVMSVLHSREILLCFDGLDGVVTEVNGLSMNFGMGMNLGRDYYHGLYKGPQYHFSDVSSNAEFQSSPYINQIQLNQNFSVHGIHPPPVAPRSSDSRSEMNGMIHPSATGMNEFRGATGLELPPPLIARGSSVGSVDVQDSSLAMSSGSMSTGFNPPTLDLTPTDFGGDTEPQTPNAAPVPPLMETTNYSLYNSYGLPIENSYLPPNQIIPNRPISYNYPAIPPEDDDPDLLTSEQIRLFISVLCTGTLHTHILSTRTSRLGGIRGCGEVIHHLQPLHPDDALELLESLLGVQQSKTVKDTIERRKDLRILLEHLKYVPAKIIDAVQNLN